MTPPRILEVTATWLIEKFSRSTDADSSDPVRDASDSSVAGASSTVPAAESDGDAVQVTVGGRTHLLDRARAAALSTQLEDALEQRREFVHTTGEHRRNGEYVVERRGADSAGHRKVFPSFDQLRRLYARLPDEFTAEDLTRSGLTAGRRHMVLWHVVEHPGFACELTSRQPLTVKKQAAEPPVGDAPSTTDESAGNEATRGWSD